MGTHFAVRPRVCTHALLHATAEKLGDFWSQRLPGYLMVRLSASGRCPRFRPEHCCGSFCLFGSNAHGRRVLAVVADADEGLVVLVLAPDDGHGRALPIWVGSSLALNGDVVPSQGPVWMGLDDGLLGCEPGRGEEVSRVSFL